MKKVKTSQTTYYRTPAYKFRQQRSSAKARGIEWNLTFEEWWSIWDASGKWSNRGHRDGQYVMGRHGDAGPYAVGNVSIITSNENHSVQRSRSRSLPIGVKRAGNRYEAKRRDMYIGSYKTAGEAHAAYLAAEVPAAQVRA